MIEVTLCLGSSCFSRGNAKALATLENFIERENLESRVKLQGAHCMGDCSLGPNIMINDRKYNSLHPDGIVDMIRHYLEREDAE